MSRILLVEDDPDCRDLMMDLLRMDGHDVTAVATGEAAIESLDASVPELVLLDISLAGSQFDGFETLARIRKLSDGAPIPVIAVSAHATKDARARALAAGFNAYVSKPFAIEDLSKVLDTFLVGAPPR